MPSLSPRMPPPEVPPERLLSSNLAALAACDLELSRRVAAARPDSLPDGVAIYPSAAGPPTVRAAALQVHSAYDPVAEAELQARQVPADAERVMLLGFGAGHLLAALLARPGLRRLDVVPMNAAVLRAVAQGVELKPLLCDPRVRFVPDDRLQLGPVLAVVPPLLRLADPRTTGLRDLALDALAIAAVRKQRAPLAGDPVPAGVTDPGWAALRGRHPGSVALLCDTGPSLEGALPLLMRLRHAGRTRAVLLATEAATLWLLGRGLAPDYALAVEAQAAPGLVGRPAPGAALVYGPGASAALISGWQGPCFACRAEDLPPRGAGLAPLDRALVLGAHFSRHVGAAGLVLLGADLGYPGGAGAAAWHRQVVAVSGGTLPASAEHIACRLTLEEFLAAHADLAVYQTSPAGARVAGASEAPLHEALSRLKIKI